MLEYVQTKDFDRALRKLRNQGGPSRLAAERVNVAVVLWKHGHEDEVTLRRTKHGESRIKHVVKYDLPGYHRLVVWEHGGLRMPLMVGTHPDVDSWLQNNKGREFSYNPKTKKVSFAPGDVPPSAIQPEEVSSFAEGPILDRIPEDLLIRLNLQQVTLAVLRANITF